jgi:osmotically-inducible protein OsmY
VQRKVVLPTQLPTQARSGRPATTRVVGKKERRSDAVKPDTQFEHDVTDGLTAAEVKHRIDQALARNAAADAERIRIETHKGTVTLRGTVRFWAERDEAVRAAWAVPGVVDVIEELVIA